MSAQASPTYDYDLLVIGAGSGDVRAARMAASYGARVAVVEQQALGGTCVNVGCIPKKLFAYASAFPAEFAAAAGFGWTLPPQNFHWPTLRGNKDREIARLNGIYGRLLDTAGVVLHKGRAMLQGPHAVVVDGATLTSRYILIATGGEPFVPEFPGREHLITSDDAFYLERMPDSSAKKIKAFSRFARAASFGYSVFCQHSTNAGSCCHARYSGRWGVKPSRLINRPTDTSLSLTPNSRRISFFERGAGV